MIRMTNVEKTYENGTHALNGISFEIQDGEFVFLVGPSGSGKSTIIKLLTGELVPSRGRVMINGFSMSNLTRRQLPQLRRPVPELIQAYRLLKISYRRDVCDFDLVSDLLGCSDRNFYGILVLFRHTHLTEGI